MEDRFSKFSKYIFLAGIIVALYVLITSFLHTSIGAKIYNPVTNPAPASQFMGPSGIK